MGAQRGLRVLLLFLSTHKRLCCANSDCGRIFDGKSAKMDLRNHFVECVECHPKEPDHAQYESYGLWRCTVCDQWFSKRGKHDCTVGDKVNPVEARRLSRLEVERHLRAHLKTARAQRAGPRRHPEAEGGAPFAGLNDRRNQEVGDGDVPNNYRGGIAARAEAEV